MRAPGTKLDVRAGRTLDHDPKPRPGWLRSDNRPANSGPSRSLGIRPPYPKGPRRARPLAGWIGGARCGGSARCRVVQFLIVHDQDRESISGLGDHPDEHAGPRGTLGPRIVPRPGHAPVHVHGRDVRLYPADGHLLGRHVTILESSRKHLRVKRLDPISPMQRLSGDVGEVGVLREDGGKCGRVVTIPRIRKFRYNSLDSRVIRHEKIPEYFEAVRGCNLCWQPSGTHRYLTVASRTPREIALSGLVTPWGERTSGAVASPGRSIRWESLDLVEL